MTTLIRTTSIVLLLFFAAFVSTAQTGPDIGVEIELANDTARGGEPFAFTVRITNSGTTDAKDVIVLADTGNQNAVLYEITSGISPKGECESTGEQWERTWRCKIGDLRPGEATTLDFAGKIGDYDGAPEAPLGFYFRKGQSSESERPTQNGGPQSYPNDRIATVSAQADEADTDQDNNYASVMVRLMPSSNRAPKVVITSPHNDALLTRPAKKSTSFEFKIEASDPDGTIEKVVISDPKYAPRLAADSNGIWKYVYLDKRYNTAEELERFMKSNPPPEVLAQRTGKNTFVYRLTDPAWDRNMLSVTAYDNGGRFDNTSVRFFVKGDAAIEIVSPKKDQIIAPGSTVVIETLSQINEGPIKELFIFNNILVGGSQGKPPQMELVSKQGNVYRHRYLWKDIKANTIYTSVQVRLVEASGAVTDSDPVSFLPRNIPRISFTSITNGKVFTSPKEIPIRYDIADRNYGDDYRLYIDGKYRTSVESFIWKNPEPGAHTIQVLAAFSEVEVGRSELITIYVK